MESHFGFCVNLTNWSQLCVDVGSLHVKTVDMADSMLVWIAYMFHLSSLLPFRLATSAPVNGSKLSG
jgi:hypothetical protein